MKKTRKLLLKMVYTALFIALTFAATYIKIDFSIGGMIHLGNFVAILAALLFGGLIGGISGSIGMGLYDIIYGYPYTTVIRTFIVKFCFCFIVGSLLRILLKKEKEYKILPLILSIIFFIIGSLSLFLYFTQPELLKEPLLFLLSAILMYVFSILFLVLLLIGHKIQKLLRLVILSSSIGVMVNVILEFILRTLFLVLVGENFHSAVVASILKTPSALVNSIITIMMVFIFFMPLYLSTRKINSLNDIEMN